MSSFRRKVKAPETPVEITETNSSSSTLTPSTPSLDLNASSSEPAQSGWKPWIFTGQGIVSSGHRELDELLGGGIPLSTLSLYEIENTSNYGKIIAAYSIAESLSHGHEVLLLGPSKKSINDMISLLPRNMKVERDPSSSSSSTIDEDVEEKSMKSLSDSSVLDEDEKNKEENDLKIAWQYKKYIQKKNVVKKDNNSDKLSFCCSFDLSEKLQSSLLSTLTTHLYEEESDEIIDQNDEKEEDLLNKRLLYVNKIIKNYINYNKNVLKKSPNSIYKIYFIDFQTFLLSSSLSSSSSLFTSYKSQQILSRFFLNLKRYIRDSRINLTFLVKTSFLKLNLITLLENYQDIVVGIESFTSKVHCVPYEFKDFLSFFLIKKLQSIGMLSSFVPRDIRYGIKQDRRKLYIEPLHLPPEESRTFQTTGGCAPTKPKSSTSAPSTTNTASSIASTLSSSFKKKEHGGECKDHSDCTCEKNEPSTSTLSPSKPIVESSTPSTPPSTTTVTPEASTTPTNSIAASLAAARARRAASKTSSTFASPISINKAPTNLNKDSNKSLDF